MLKVRISESLPETVDKQFKSWWFVQEFVTKVLDSKIMGSCDAGDMPVTTFIPKIERIGEEINQVEVTYKSSNLTDSQYKALFGIVLEAVNKGLGEKDCGAKVIVISHREMHADCSAKTTDK